MRSYLVFLAALGLMAWGCSSSSSGSDGSVNDGKDAGTDSGADGASDAADNGGVCDEQELTLELAGVRVMLLVDASGSMLSNGKWDAAKAAIGTMVNDTANAGTWFGLDVFPDSGLLKCSTDNPPVIDVGPNKGGDIVTWMGNNKPSIIALTPLVGALESYMLTPTSALNNPDTANYLVVVSDGDDDCFLGGGNFQDYDKLNILAGIVHDLKDSANIKTIAIGFGDSAPAGTLGVIAKNGGTSFDHFIPASDQAQLTAALQEIAQAIRPCRYLIQTPVAGADPAKVNFYFDGVLVPRDRTKTDGWNWTQNDKLEVEFHGPACQQIKSGTVKKVSATFGCPTKTGSSQQVCGMRDSFLGFPPVAVLLLLDFSGSMADASKWQDATTAITSMVTDDRNNHVEFGLDLFPDATLLGDKCALQPYPNVPVGAYNTFQIIDTISNNDPFGDTPLLEAVKNVTYRPGRIGEERVSGSLVVISDGADTCAPSGTDVPAGLSAAVGKLVSDHGVKVFAIGFGSQVSADELNAIAQAGGTGLNTFSQANNQADLDSLFKMISSMVTSCTFEVPYGGADVDYRLVNFYLDGFRVPRDTSHQNGWDWVNPVTMTQVQFFGVFCDELKNGQISDVVVEFGCETQT